MNASEPSNEAIEAELRDFQAWKSTAPEHPFTLFDYVFCIGTPDLLFAFMALLRPRLIVHEGAHFLASGFDPGVHAQWKQKNLRPSEIQRVMNHIHMGTLFQQQDVSDRVAVEASRALAEIWTAVFAEHRLRGIAIGETFDDAAVTLVGEEAALPS